MKTLKLTLATLILATSQAKASELDICLGIIDEWYQDKIEIIQSVANKYPEYTPNYTRLDKLKTERTNVCLAEERQRVELEKQQQQQEAAKNDLQSISR